MPTRLMAALLYQKHVYALSDEDVVERWVENPYWQHFSGERYFRHELPCDPSSLVRWRQRIGEAMHALLCGAGHNLRMILARLRVLYGALAGQLVLVAMLVATALLPQPVLKRGGN